MVRIRLTFQLQDRRQNQLPINYQYAVSAWVYKMLHNGNPEFSEWLHNQGYSLENKKFKLFCFSELQFGKNGCRFRHPDRLQISASSFDLVVSMAIPEAVNYFVMGIFKEQKLVLGDRNSRVPLYLSSVENLAAPDFSNNRQGFSTLSPICVSKPEMRNGKPMPQYLEPNEGDFERVLLANLQNKYKAFLQKDDITYPNWDVSKISFKLLNIQQKRLVHLPRRDMRSIKVRGYLMDFELCAPVDLLRFGYFAGFGEKNGGLGFGCVRFMK